MFGLNETRPDWKVNAKNWPHHEKSRFVSAAGLNWHVQEFENPGAKKLLLIHGTGGATHSFAPLIDRLRDRFEILTMDLPGHGFTDGATSNDLSLPGMAKALTLLLHSLKFKPDIAVGHSAGTAILLQMELQGHLNAKHIIGINSALKPIAGNAIFSPLAKLMFMNPLTPRVFNLRARYGDLANFLFSATGSQIGDEAKKQYTLLMENPAHVKGAIGMMANWELEPLVSALERIETKVTLLVSEDDKMVPATVSTDISEKFENISSVSTYSGGHLIHEVNPGWVADQVLKIAEE